MNLRDAYYEQRFEAAFLRAKGDEFQTMFERLMSLAYKADFMACRPWGNVGDRKNDGFLKSERRLFQVYAPNEMEATKAVAKISEDFIGALTHWSKDFDKWTFVHNAVDGLPPHVHRLLLDFESENAGVRLDPWGLEELRLVFRKLNTADRESWFGLAPTEETSTNLGFADLQVVLEVLAASTVPLDGPVKIVPPGKLEANGLSESVAILIKCGMAKTRLVADFLAHCHDESLDQRIAQAFRLEYQRLRGTFRPNQIFAELQVWVGGGRVGTPEHQMAVLTVLAYYFESCDIFEEPRSLKS
jgi:hypothetical protein